MADATRYPAQPGPCVKARPIMRVHARSDRATQGRLTFGPLTLACALGRSGLTHAKREGDGATPAGDHRLVGVLYRADRIARPRTRLPLRPLRRDEGWCDDPGHGRYNRPVRLPFSAAHEKLWREDHLYDVIVILDQNRRPRIRGRGSAVFLHLARPGHRPTQGCVAVCLADMRRLLAMSGPGTTMRID